MNLRILKKLSKRAAPLLVQLGDHRKQFPAEPYDNYTSSHIGARKHWERTRCHPSHETELGKREPTHRYYKTRQGHIVCMDARYLHPWPGTMMIGSVTGYYEPEWDEETCWDALREWVLGHFIEYSEHAIRHTREMRTVSQILAAAADLIEEKRCATG